VGLYHGLRPRSNCSGSAIRNRQRICVSTDGRSRRRIACSLALYLFAGGRGVTVESERKAIDQVITNMRRIVTGARQSIRRPQQQLVAAKREEEAPGEAHTSPE
jgi:hypothetical protein